MKKVPANDRDSDIISRRVVTGRRLAELLNQTGSSATLADIEDIIFNEPADIQFSRQIATLLRFFETPGRDIDHDVLLPVLQDAWNYFPHRRLDGQCPAKLFGPNMLE
ncbi:MAG: hypothetical protein ABL907_23920 [Hyphomicrobium sp.]